MRVEYDVFTGEKLRQSLKSAPAYIKLVNEAEGCSAGGVFTLHLLNEPSPTDVRVESPDFDFLVDRQEQILFDDVMRLQADETFPSYRLSSDSMLFSNHVVVKDKRPA
ncbi:hypothetical protein D3C71_1804990 [compost metagenome]